MPPLLADRIDPLVLTVAAAPLDQVIAHLQRAGIAIESGPVPGRGALGPMRAVYFRDPDGNLVGVCEHPAP